MNQGYMMYPMMEQGYQWPQPYYGDSQNRSVDSGRTSKSKSNEKDGSKKNGRNQNLAPSQNGQIPQPALNQFVPVYMIPPGFQGHPGAFNAALAAHAASQGNVPNMYQMPTYGHFNQGYLPYGYPQPASQKTGYYGNHYSGSDYNTNSSVHTGSQAGDSSHRNSKSSDNSSKRNSRSTTSKDSARHSVENDSMKKNSIKRLPPLKNTKKVQSTFTINISKTNIKAKTQSVAAQSCGRSHSIGSDLSAGCSASACVPQMTKRSCSHDSDDSSKVDPSNILIKCCSTDCDHVGPIFQNMRKFSNNTDFKKPDGELTKKLIELIEFYLSDEYLAKDKYLLRQIRCKSEGYISIKLMTSFKKVKKLTRDWRAVRFALLQTGNLIVSDEGFRVKRATQLPENLRKPRLLSSVVTIRLTEEMSSVDAITNMFAKHGEIGLVRILKPGKEIPSDLRNYATQVPDIGKTTCAVVDFEQSESALQAVRCLKDELSDQKMRLALLGPRVRRTLYKQDTKDEDEDADETPVEAKLVMEQEPTSVDEAATVSNLESSFKKIVIQAKAKQVGRVDSHDSGNQDESSGSHSNDEDLKAVVFHDDNSKKETATIKTTITSPLVTKIQIFREPEGPGANATNGFAVRRSQFAN